MREFSEGEGDAVRSLLKILAMSGLGGAAAGLGAGAVRSMNPRYEPPEAPPPVIVDMPVPARAPVAGPVPVPAKSKPAALPPKAASFSERVGELATGLWDRVQEHLPTVRHPLGPTGAQTAGEIPAYYAAAAPVVGAGALGGFALGDRIARSAERRRAQAELDAARKEYQDVVTARTAQTYFPKAAAGVVDLLEGRTPADPILARAKAALDAAWAAKRAEGGVEPPAAPAIDPADPGRGMTTGQKAMLGWLYPGLLSKDTAPAQMGLLGALGATGAYAGYRLSRDEAEADRVRKQTEARDRANAAAIPAPVVARLVPVPT